MKIENKRCTYLRNKDGTDSSYCAACRPREKVVVIVDAANKWLTNPELRIALTRSDYMILTDYHTVATWVALSWQFICVEAVI